MAKKTEVLTNEELTSALARKEEALSQARKGLFRIIGTDPVSFKPEPGKPPGIIKAFEAVKEVAERTVLNMSDAESPLNG